MTAGPGAAGHDGSTAAGLVAVGVDGSPVALGAAELAADEAVRRGWPLRLVHAGAWPAAWPHWPVPAPAEADEILVKPLAEAVARIRVRYPDLPLTLADVPGPAAGVLVDQSRQADLVIVGNRGLGGFAGLLAGSVSTQLAAYGSGVVLVDRDRDRIQAAPRPMAVGRAVAGPVVMGAVVVGADGSPGAAPAMRFAAEEARLRGVPLIAIFAADGGSVHAPAARRGEAEGRARAESRAQAEDLGHDDVPVGERRRVPGDPRTVLVDASAWAGLVVVGSRGYGGPAGPPLGSVGQALVHHSHCPVAIVHIGHRPMGDDRGSTAE